MRKKIITLFCMGAILLSLAGCGDEKKDKKTTEASTQTFNLPPFDTEEPVVTESTESTEAPVDEEKDWITVGSELTGYVDVPSNYREHESSEGEGLYALQYISEQDGGLVSIVQNNYGYDTADVEVDDPGEVIILAYIESYENDNNGEHILTDEVVMDGVTFHLSVDCLPPDSVTEYEYWLYTYVTYTNDRFYTLIVEGREDTVTMLAERAEKTFRFSEGGGADDGFGGTVGGNGVAGWNDYQVVVDGDKYTLPCEFSDMEAQGWVLDSLYEGDTIGSEEYSVVYVERNGYTAWIVIGNIYESGDIPVRDGQIVGINIDYDLEGTDSYAAGGVELGMSYDEVIAILGEPTDSYGDDDYITLTYNSPDYEEDFFSCLEVFIMDGTVTELDIRHW